MSGIEHTRTTRNFCESVAQGESKDPGSVECLSEPMGSQAVHGRPRVRDSFLVPSVGCHGLLPHSDPLMLCFLIPVRMRGELRGGGGRRGEEEDEEKMKKVKKYRKKRKKKNKKTKTLTQAASYLCALLLSLPDRHQQEVIQ